MRRRKERGRRVGVGGVVCGSGRSLGDVDARASGVGRGGGVRPVRRGVGVERQLPALPLHGLPLPGRRVPVLRERPPRRVLLQVAVEAVALRSPQI